MRFCKNTKLYVDCIESASVSVLTLILCADNYYVNIDRGLSCALHGLMAVVSGVSCNVLCPDSYVRDRLAANRREGGI
jgi:hypothetical protein